MPDLTLYIGDRNLSSWSLRAWLALAQAGATFEEVMIPLDQPGSVERIRAVSPGGTVPALRHGDLVVWESLAICEYVAELFPAARLWPENRTTRAVARAAATEMHGGFPDMRRELSMEIAARHPTPALSPAARADVDRVLAIWADCLARFGVRAGGPFLFGAFSIADAMYAPVVTRFVTYAIDVPPEARAYMDGVLALPAMRRWVAAAEREVDGTATR